MAMINIFLKYLEHFCVFVTLALKPNSLMTSWTAEGSYSFSLIYIQCGIKGILIMTQWMKGGGP